MTEPPGNSLGAEQRARVAAHGGDLAEGARALLARIGEEIEFSRAKGSGPYRLGMHDGLRFAEDAVADLLRSHGLDVELPEHPGDA